MIGPVPTIGRTVHYTLTQADADAINARRAGATKLNAAGVTLASQNLGALIHTGNRAEEGDVYPMVIVRVWGDRPESAVNGQVHLDGNDLHWVTSVQCGSGPRYWTWPVLP
ncbi:hypothetical protein [Amycolatopsis sp. NPDC021455]|uniref:hypothetical protein n=1 Tax=Amycolatopsis sp. NPDC021455 TaxID=3154901 RepID=UPI0034088712